MTPRSGGMTRGELALMVQELAPLAGLQLQRIVAPRPHTLALRFMRRWVLVCVSPSLPRLHALAEAPATPGEEPPAFCLKVRRTLQNQRLESITQVPDERVVRLAFPGGALVVELVGQGANLALLDPADRVLLTLRPGADARLTPGAPYAPPRPMDRGTVQAPRCRQGLEAERLFARLELERRRAELTRRVTRERRRVTRLCRNLETDLDRCAAAQVQRKQADLLLAHTSTLPPGRGQEQAEVADLFEAGEPLSIPLCPPSWRTSRGSTTSTTASPRACPRWRRGSPGPGRPWRP